MDGWSGFRNDGQRARVCRAILAPVGLEDLWSGDGPRPESLGYRRGDDEQGREMRLLLMIAWAIWTRSQALSLADLLDLEDERLRLVGELLGALSRGPEGVDAWLRQASTRAAAPSGRASAPSQPRGLAGRGDDRRGDGARALRAVRQHVLHEVRTHPERGVPLADRPE